MFPKVESVVKEREKRSLLWHKYNDEEFRELVKKSQTYSDILRDHGMSNKGGNCNTLKKRIAKLGVNDDHIAKGHSSNKGKKFISKKIPLNKILVENSTYNRGHLKNRIIEEKLIDYKCQKCGITNKWEGSELVLVLDHINGVSNDHRLKNLRFLCPNCNSQTKTFAGRSKRKRYYCEQCGKEKSYKHSKKCKSCAAKDLEKRKVQNRPSKEELAEMIDTMSWLAIGKKYGVSDNAIRKWARSYGIIS